MIFPFILCFKKLKNYVLTLHWRRVLSERALLLSIPGTFKSASISPPLSYKSVSGTAALWIIPARL